MRGQFDAPADLAADMRWTRVDLDTLERRNTYCSSGNRIRIPWSSSPRTSHCIDWAVWVHFKPIIGVCIYECFWYSLL